MLKTLRRIAYLVYYNLVTLFMKPSIRERYTGSFPVQELRGYKLYDWQRHLLSRFSDEHYEYRVYFRDLV